MVPQINSIIEKSQQIQSVNELLEQSNKSLEKHVEEIKNSEQKIQAILEQATEDISIYSIDKKLVYETASVKHILGSAPEHLANKEGISFIHEQATRVIKNY
jgi:transcriptional regulator with PAS, ATPase and Fis domain